VTLNRRNQMLITSFVWCGIVICNSNQFISSYSLLI
jgi:hypothetical protein